MDQYTTENTFKLTLLRNTLSKSVFKLNVIKIVYLFIEWKAIYFYAFIYKATFYDYIPFYYHITNINM